MVAVGTVEMPDAMEKSGASFDVATPESRARLLAMLRTHREEFTLEERQRYNQIRDIVMRVARGEKPPDVEVHMAALGHYLEEKELVPDGAPVVETEPEKVAPSVVPEAVVMPAIETPPLPAQVQAESMTMPVSTPSGIARGRRGPDITAFIASLHIPPAPVVPPSSGESTVEVPVSSSPEAPVVSLREHAPQPTAIEKEHSLASLKADIEEVNDDLNTFAHGTAFKWLSDEKTGYRAYLNELLELRALLSSPNIPETEFSKIQERLAGLHTMAETVRKNVGIVSSVPTILVMPKTEPVPEPIAPVAPMPPVVTTEAPMPPSPRENGEVQRERITISEPPKPFTIEAHTTTDEPLNIEPRKIPLQSMVDTPYPVPPAESMRETPEPTPTKAEVSEVPILTEDGVVEVPATLVAEEEGMPQNLLAPNEPESALMDKIAVPESHFLDPLHAGAIDSGLNDLLVRWLGPTGFLGMGKSGVSHPDWEAMKDVLVEEALNPNGFLPEGLSGEVFDNLGQNIRSWRQSFGLIPDDGELVEHYLRRVVVASLPVQK